MTKITESLDKVIKIAIIIIFYVFSKIEKSVSIKKYIESIKMT